MSSFGAFCRLYYRQHERRYAVLPAASRVVMQGVFREALWALLRGLLCNGARPYRAVGDVGTTLKTAAKAAIFAALPRFYL
jgi:hypothetical protein